MTHKECCELYHQVWQATRTFKRGSVIQCNLHAVHLVSQRGEARNLIWTILFKVEIEKPNTSYQNDRNPDQWSNIQWFSTECTNFVDQSTNAISTWIFNCNTFLEGPSHYDPMNGINRWMGKVCIIIQPIQVSGKEIKDFLSLGAWGNPVLAFVEPGATTPK